MTLEFATFKELGDSFDQQGTQNNRIEIKNELILNL